MKFSQVVSHSFFVVLLGSNSAKVRYIASVHHAKGCSPSALTASVAPGGGAWTMRWLAGWLCWLGEGHTLVIRESPT